MFLTTIKPQREVVTAQDVQSSLYYMHLDRAEDYELLSSVRSSDDLSDNEGHGDTPASLPDDKVRRKPLPSGPVSSLEKPTDSPPKVSAYLQKYSNGSTGSLQSERKPLSQDNTDEHRRAEARPPLPDRKPIGPRPMRQRFFSVDDSPLQDIPEKQNIDLRRRSEQPARAPPKLPPRSSSEDKHDIPMTPPRSLAARLRSSPVANNGHSSFSHRKPAARSNSHGFNREIEDGLHSKSVQEASLSLIRRYDNDQWTVGKILSNGTKTAANEFGEFNSELSIQIMTPGYLRFVDFTNPFARQAGTITEKSNVSHDIYRPITAGVEQLYFHRHLQPSGSAVSLIQKHRPESTDSAFVGRGTRPDVDPPRHRHHSLDSSESNRSLTDGVPELRSLSKKAFTFRSPWDGMCEFTTGVAGRSLKCRHSYASQIPGFRPGVHSAQVSELRFNLPSSKTFKSTASRSVALGSPRDGKRSSLFMPQHRRHSPSSFEANDTNGTVGLAPKVELEERLDLSLGQERAGGGFGGKRAKLGKLIVEKEGLQMLDLIVAANIALWWRVYERIT